MRTISGRVGVSDGIRARSHEAEGERGMPEDGHEAHSAKLNGVSDGIRTRDSRSHSPELYH